MHFIASIFALFPCYLAGCLPTGILVARYYGRDVANTGSGNIGATNVARVVGKRAGIITLFIDALKGALVVFLADLIIGDHAFAAWAGLAVIAGHCFSLPWIWKGGKGVATGFGVFLFLCPIAALGGLVSFGVVFAASRIVSVSSVSAAVTIPAFMLFLSYEDPAILPATLIAMLVIFRHKPNLIRVLEGTEQRLTFS